jgi:hypothetical protein
MAAIMTLTHKQIAAAPEDATETCPACGKPLKRVERETPAGGTFVLLTCPTPACERYRGRDPK